jgi:hypothetical protein
MPDEYVKSLADLLAREYGVKTDYRLNPRTAVVNIAVTQVFATSPRRVGMCFLNLSANTIYIAPDEEVAATRGVLLTPTGGSFSLIWNEDFELVTFPWWATAAANNSALLSIEIFIV